MNVVGAQGIAEQPCGPERGGAAFEIPQQRRTDALALPAILDRQPELEISGVRLKSITGFADNGLDAVEGHERDHAEAVILAGMDEVTEFGRRQLPHRAEEAVVAGADRERAEVTLQDFGVLRLDKTHRQRLAIAQPQDIGVLPQVIETKRNHRMLPPVREKTMAGVPRKRRRQPGCI
jgi:hypothetical protein